MTNDDVVMKESCRCFVLPLLYSRWSSVGSYVAREARSPYAERNRFECDSKNSTQIKNQGYQIRKYWQKKIEYLPLGLEYHIRLYIHFFPFFFGNFCYLFLLLHLCSFWWWWNFRSVSNSTEPNTNPYIQEWWHHHSSRLRHHLRWGLADYVMCLGRRDATVEPRLLHRFRNLHNNNGHMTVSNKILNLFFGN